MRDGIDGAPHVTQPASRFDHIPPTRRRLSVPERVTLVGALVVLTGAVGTLVTGAADDAAPQAGPGTPVGSAAGPAPPVSPVLLAHQDGAGRASWITVLVPAETGRGGAVVLLPPGTMTEVASLGLEPVGHSLELGPARLQGAVENLLGARLATVSVVDDASLAELLQPAGPLQLTVPEPVEQVEEGGRVQVLFPAGPIQLAPGDAGRFLTARGRGSDLSRLARHQAFWDAWLEAVRTRPGALPTVRAELTPPLAALAGGRVRVRVVPVEGFGSGGEGGELYKVRTEDLHRLVEAVFPAGTRPAPGDRPRVQILNGTGTVGLAEAVRSRLGPAYDVRFTGNAPAFGQERTEVVFYRREQQAAAQRLREALGVGELVLSRRALDVVDVTVVVGRDFQP